MQRFGYWRQNSCFSRIKDVTLKNRTKKASQVLQQNLPYFFKCETFGLFAICLVFSAFLTFNQNRVLIVSFYFSCLVMELVCHTFAAISSMSNKGKRSVDCNRKLVFLLLLFASNSPARRLSNAYVCVYNASLSSTCWPSKHFLFKISLKLKLIRFTPCVYIAPLIFFGSFFIFFNWSPSFVSPIYNIDCLFCRLISAHRIDENV